MSNGVTCKGRESEQDQGEGGSGRRGRDQANGDLIQGQAKVAGEATQAKQKKPVHVGPTLPPSVLFRTLNWAVGNTSLHPKSAALYSALYLHEFKRLAVAADMNRCLRKRRRIAGRDVIEAIHAGPHRVRVIGAPR